MNTRIPAIVSMGFDCAVREIEPKTFDRLADYEQGMDQKRLERFVPLEFVEAPAAYGA